MAKNVYQHLEELTGERSESIDYSRLVRKFADTVKQYDEEDMHKAASYQQGKELNERHIDWMNRVIAEELEKETDHVDGNLPISSVFEAYQRVKSASYKAPRDLGVRILATHLEKMWKFNKSANLTVADMLKVKDHYTRNYPKSAASELIEEISSEGYFILPVDHLVSVASMIRTQEDYDYYIKEAGLAGANPFQKKSRNFILALINGEPEAVAESKTANPLLAPVLMGGAAMAGGAIGEAIGEKMTAGGEYEEELSAPSGREDDWAADWDDNASRSDFDNSGDAELAWSAAELVSNLPDGELKGRLSGLNDVKLVEFFKGLSEEDLASLVEQTQAPSYEEEPGSLFDGQEY